VRGTPSAIKGNGVSDEFGSPIAELRQNTEWFNVMGMPLSLAK